MIHEDDPVFAYDQTVEDRYPTIRAGIAQATELVNGPSPDGLLAEYRAEQRAVSERLETVAIADLPSVAAWRRAFTLFGAKPTQYRSAAEALLRRLSKTGDIPSINALVDVGNLVSIRHGMPVAVFDLAAIHVPVTVRFATGNEVFNDLGSNQELSPDRGEVVFVDVNNVVCARRWCWRQSAESATSPDTTQALIVIEGLHPTALGDVKVALADLLSLLASQQPGSRIRSYVLSAASRPIPPNGDIKDDR
jgi:DNA/RNA-binding domain of Phe-tRNA-synthetase-like protein